MRRALVWLGFAAVLAVLLPLAAFAQAEEPVLSPAGDVPAAPRVVVLPLRVESPQPIAYLGASLADLLRKRLEESGQLEVLQPSDANTPAEAAVSNR